MSVLGECFKSDEANRIVRDPDYKNDYYNDQDSDNSNDPPTMHEIQDLFNPKKTIHKTHQEPINRSFQAKKADSSESLLYVITSVYSPHGQGRRSQLAQDFIERMEALEEEGQPVALYVVEVVYDNQDLLLRLKNDHRHLKLNLPSSVLMWSKENLLNFATRHLPRDWQYMAWIDADIEFLDAEWATKTIKMFQTRNLDVIQLFSTAVMQSTPRGPPYLIRKGIVACKQEGIIEERHPGFAWAITRKAFRQMKGLLDVAIVGGGDHIMATCWLGEKNYLLYYSQGLPSLRQMFLNFYDRVQGFNVSYLDTVVLHYYHGTRKNRLYSKRIEILRKHQFDPFDQLSRESTGLLFPSPRFPRGLARDLDLFFERRKEV